MSDQQTTARKPHLSATKVAAGLAFISGQVPRDLASGQVVAGDFKAQLRQVLDNLGTRLKAVDLELSDVVRTTLYVTDPDNFAAANEVYAEFFPVEPPTRTALVVAGLANSAYLVEVDAIAAASGDHQ